MHAAVTNSAVSPIRSTSATLTQARSWQGSSLNGATEASAVRVNADPRTAESPLPTTSPTAMTVVPFAPSPDEEEVSADVGSRGNDLGGDRHPLPLNQGRLKQSIADRAQVDKLKLGGLQSPPDRLRVARRIAKLAT